jgi:hypothetical protein
MADLQGTMAQQLQEGTYVQVYGNFKGGLAENPGALGPITVFAFYPVEDHNQVTQLSILTVAAGEVCTCSVNAERTSG